MKTFSHMTLSAFALLTSIATAQAHTQLQDYQTYPADRMQQAQATPVPPPPPVPPATMPMQGMADQAMPMGCPMMDQFQSGSSGTMPMMQMMGQGGGTGMLFEHIKGRIAFLEAEIGITDAQRGQWNAFAEALRRNAEVHKTMQQDMRQEMMGPNTSAPSNWLERLQRQAQIMSTQTEALKAVEAAAGPLYAVLSEDQRRMAERLLSGPMGMMM
jgi:hypothetical protein